MNANPDRVAKESRFDRRLDRAVARATTPRGATLLIARTPAATVITVGTGVLMTLVDGETFRRSDRGVVGRPDRHDGRVRRRRSGDLAGRLVAVLVMLAGVAFLTVSPPRSRAPSWRAYGVRRSPGGPSGDGGASPSTRQPARTNRSRSEPLLVAVAPSPSAGWAQGSSLSIRNRPPGSGTISPLEAGSAPAAIVKEGWDGASRSAPQPAPRSGIGACPRTGRARHRRGSGNRGSIGLGRARARRQRASAGARASCPGCSRRGRRREPRRHRRSATPRPSGSWPTASAAWCPSG